MRTIVFFFLLATPLLSLTAFAQEDYERIEVGQIYEVETEIYDQARKLRISLPPGYQADGQPYPVLYLLDGQNWFLEALSQRQVLSMYGYTPPFIIVGIDTEDQPRFRFFNQSSKLQDHLEQELIPFVESRFHTSEQRLLFGWQFAGAFAIQTLADRPSLFSSWFAASPFPIAGARVTAVENQLKAGSIKSETLVFGTSLNENSVEEGAMALQEVLTKSSPETLIWKYAKLNFEDLAGAGHRTTPIGTLYQGLRTVFRNYPTLEFNTLEDYNALGGFSYVQDYYSKRAVTYGLSQDIPQEGMFFLIRMCLDSEDYLTFDFWMEKFAQTNFLNEMNLGWNTRFAEFHLTNNEFNKAIALYSKLQKRFPESPRPIHGMARAYEAKGDDSAALAHYQSAVDLAEKHEESRLAQYRKDLERFKNK